MSLPTDVVESAGTGIEGTVDGRRVIVGGRRFVRRRGATRVGEAVIWPSAPGVVLSAVAVDGQVAGALALAGRVRPEAAVMLRSLRHLGVDRVVLASGDAAAVAQSVAGDLGLDEVRVDFATEEKVELVLAERLYGPVLMVVDCVNDAPALAAADVGVALGVRGGAASSEVADAVLLVDRSRRGHRVRMMTVMPARSRRAGHAATAGRHIHRPKRVQVRRDWRPFGASSA